MKYITSVLLGISIGLLIIVRIQQKRLEILLNQRAESKSSPLHADLFLDGTRVDELDITMAMPEAQCPTLGRVDMSLTISNSSYDPPRSHTWDQMAACPNKGGTLYGVHYAVKSGKHTYTPVFTRIVP